MNLNKIADLYILLTKHESTLAHYYLLITVYWTAMIKEVNGKIRLGEEFEYDPN